VYYFHVSYVMFFTFLEQEALPSLLSTGWFKEWI